MHCTCEVLSLSRHSHNNLGRTGAYLAHMSDVSKEPLDSRLMLLELILLLLSEKVFILRKTERDVIRKVHRYSCKASLILVKILINLELSRKFLKNTRILNFMKICPLGAELFDADGRADRQTDIRKLIFTFRNFANAPND